MASRQRSTTSVQPAKPWPHDANFLFWGIVGVVAQLAFILGMVIPGAWQGPRYSVVQNTISDMEAVTAPHAWFPLICFVIGGLGTFTFAVLELRPALAAAGKVASYAPWMLACSALVLGSPFPRDPCRLVDPGCSLQVQLSSSGGLIEAILAGLGFFVLVITPIPLGHRLAVLPFWRRLVPVMKAARTIGLAGYFLLSMSAIFGTAQGLMERLLTIILVAWVAMLAGGLIVFARRGRAGTS